MSAVSMFPPAADIKHAEESKHTAALTQKSAIGHHTKI